MLAIACDAVRDRCTPMQEDFPKQCRLVQLHRATTKQAGSVANTTQAELPACHIAVAICDCEFTPAGPRVVRQGQKLTPDIT